MTLHKLTLTLSLTPTLTQSRNRSRSPKLTELRADRSSESPKGVQYKIGVGVGGEEEGVVVQEGSGGEGGEVEAGEGLRGRAGVGRRDLVDDHSHLLRRPVHLHHALVVSVEPMFTRCKGDFGRRILDIKSQDIKLVKDKMLRSR